MKDVRPRRVLVVYWHPELEELRAATKRHLEVLDSGMLKHEVVYFNAVGGVPAFLRFLRFDAIMLHTTFLCMRWSHLFYPWKWRLRWIGEVDCPKIAFPQDEYDHSEILDEWLFELGVMDIFTTFDESSRAVIYPIMSRRAHFHKCLTGYVDAAAASECAKGLVPLDQRPKDIVYRATKLPFWFGSHGQLKHRIGTVAAERAAVLGLRTDISMRFEDTIIGGRWFEFLMSGRAVVGCESGSSVLDRRGEVRAQIQRILREEPGLAFEEVSRRMPAGWDSQRFFAISPRHFEAVISKTAQILIEGQYEGILEPARHYLPVKRDLSNIDEVLARGHDTKLLQEIANNAYEDLYLSGRYDYRAFAREIEGVLLSYPPQRRASGKLARRAEEVTPAFMVRALRASERAVWKAAGDVLQLAATIAVTHRRLARGVTPAIMVRLLRDPRPALAKGVAAVRNALTDPMLRRLLVAYLRDSDVRRVIRMDTLLADLLRLSIVRRAMSRRSTDDIGFTVQLHDDPKRGTLTFRSRPIGFIGDDDQSGVRFESGQVRRRIVWDHSAISDWAPCLVGGPRGVSVYLGDSGIYEFTSLSRLAEHHPESVWRAIVPPRKGC